MQTIIQSWFSQLFFSWQVWFWIKNLFFSLIQLKILLLKKLLSFYTDMHVTCSKNYVLSCSSSFCNTSFGYSLLQFLDSKRYFTSLIEEPTQYKGYHRWSDKSSVDPSGRTFTFLPPTLSRVSCETDKN